MSGVEALQVYLLGTVDFEAAFQLQKRLHYEITGQRNQAALILCEHPPIVTVGRRGSRAHIFISPEELTTWGWRIRWVNRGGGVMLHLPGQLAMYPIVPLDTLGLKISEFVQRLGLSIGDLLGDFSVRGEFRDNPAGVWVGSRMAAGIGVSIRDWVSYLGAYINVQPPLDFYRRVCCDYRNLEPMTSLGRERRGPVSPSLVRERLVEHFQKRFDVGRVSLFTEHPLLGGFVQRSSERPAVVFSPR